MTKKETALLNEMVSKVNREITRKALAGEEVGERLSGAATVLNEFADGIAKLNEKEPVEAVAAE